MKATRDALIGFTGFVGGTLLRHHTFDGLYNSKNIELLKGERYDTIYCAGAPAAKWIANREPDADRASLDRLSSAILSARAEHIVLISTIDVYKTPDGVDEATDPPTEGLHPYGLHRLHLERTLAAGGKATVIRLPGLFGEGLKKNALFDLLHHHNVEKIESRNAFQFYDMSCLWRDIQKIRGAALPLVNLTSPPITIREIARECFDIEFTQEQQAPLVRYDVRSRFASHWNGHDGYTYSRAEVISALRSFVARSRGEKAA